MNQFFKRLTTKSPKFFVRLQNAGLIIGGIGAAIVAFPLALPAVVVTVGSYAIAVGASIATIAKLPVQNVEDLNDDK